MRGLNVSGKNVFMPTELFSRNQPLFEIGKSKGTRL